MLVILQCFLAAPFTASALQVLTLKPVVSAVTLSVISSYVIGSTTGTISWSVSRTNPIDWFAGWFRLVGIKCDPIIGMPRQLARQFSLTSTSLQKYARVVERTVCHSSCRSLEARTISLGLPQLFIMVFMPLSSVSRLIAVLLAS